MHNIEASGYLVIGGFGKTLADMRHFVRLADEFGLADSTPCNAVVNCRVDATELWPGGASNTVFFTLPADEPGQAAGR